MVCLVLISGISERSASSVLASAKYAAHCSIEIVTTRPLASYFATLLVRPPNAASESLLVRTALV